MELKLILEAILFSAQKPMTPRELREVLSSTAAQSEEPAVKALKKTRDEEVQASLETLAGEHANSSRSFVLVCVAGAWQFASRPEYAPWLMVLLGQRPRPPRLSQPALETLAIVAYRQPVTRAEIEQVRGVAVDGVMSTLVERGLVEQVGRAEVAGRPLTYGTTAFFLEHFGLRSLEELPAADELRRIPVQKPETLLTASETAEASAPPGAGKDAPPAAPADAHPPRAETGESPVMEQTSLAALLDPDSALRPAPEVRVEEPGAAPANEPAAIAEAPAATDLPS